MRRVLIVLVLMLALTSVALIATPVSASHWCAPSSLTMTPIRGWPGAHDDFTFTFYNNIAEGLVTGSGTEYGFHVYYSWLVDNNGVPLDYGFFGTTIPAYGSYTFRQTYVTMPLSQGDYTVNITVYGKAGTDAAYSRCYFTKVFPVYASSGLTATAGATPTSGIKPLQVNFTASASNGAAPFTYAWNFGDGGTSAQQNPVHTYQSAGNYHATVRATDAVGETGDGYVFVAVTGADFSTTKNGLEVSFTANASGGQSPYNFAWNFGDGTTGGPTTSLSTTHTYAVGGNYSVELSVTDQTGRMIGTASHTIQVSSSLPPAPVPVSVDAGLLAGASLAIIAAVVVAVVVIRSRRRAF